MWFRTRFVLDRSTRSCRCEQSHCKPHNGHADSPCGSIVERSRERIAPRISSRTSLKHHIHFSFILKLTIFIYKQLKRPAAFSAVQSDCMHQSLCEQCHWCQAQQAPPQQSPYPTTTAPCHCPCPCTLLTQRLPLTEQMCRGTR